MNHPPIDMSELRFFATTTVLGPGKGGYPIVHGVKCEYEGRFYAFDIAQDFFRPLHRQKNKKSTS